MRLITGSMIGISLERVYTWLDEEEYVDEYAEEACMGVSTLQPRVLFDVSRSRP